MMNFTRSQIRKLGVAGLMALGFTLQQAQAAVDASVTTAIATGVTDSAIVGGSILALVIGIAIFRHMRGAK